VNQYGCTIDEPFIGAGEPVADVRIPVTVLQPPADDAVENDVVENDAVPGDEIEGEVSSRSARR
jgi:hypothetical protein